MSVLLYNKLGGEQGLLRLIYAYDNTYKHKFSDDVVSRLWSQRWLRYHRTMTCPYARAVVGFLMKQFDVDPNNPTRKGKWFQHNYFPDNMALVPSYDEDDDKMQVRVYMNVQGRTTCVFDGMVLTAAQHAREKQLYENVGMFHMDVYRDDDTGMVVYLFMN